MGTYYKVTANIPETKTHVYNMVEEIARREHVSLNKILIKALEEFAEAHKEGNPQKPLFQAEKGSSYGNPVAEKMKGNLEAMYATVKSIGPMSLQQIRGHFARIFGVKRKTIDEYVRILEGAHKLRSVGTKWVAVEE
jgi:hypothetical protein